MANNVRDEKQVAVFLNLLSPTRPKDKTFTEIVEVLTKHFEPKPLEIVVRFNFNQRQQEDGESVAQYVAELRRLTTLQFWQFLGPSAAR